MQEVAVVARSIDGLDGYARPKDLARYREVAAGVARSLEGRTLWHVNSTAGGGGVAELLHELLGYVASSGVSCRWIVIDGDPSFFRITKRIHNRLHGSPGDGGELGAAEHNAYRAVLERELGTFLPLARPGDVAVLHDPQTAGLVEPLRGAGLSTVWVCHVGIDQPDEIARSAWDFLRPEIHAADALVFSRRAYVWKGLEDRPTFVIPPCIDPISAKNAEIGAAGVGAVLGAARVLPTFDAWEEARVEVGAIGTVRVHRPAEIVEEAPTPPGAPIVVQVSRWDRLKDHAGVLRAFAEHVPSELEAHLLLVGPSPASVSDDPEGVEVFEELHELWSRLPPDRRRRMHLVNLPVDDRIENAVVVNALQQRAEVVVQKSLAEGFGLTVAEAMWKTRPVVGSRVGGIQDQIADGRSGILVGPTDLPAIGSAIGALIADMGFAQAIGHAARERVRERFLPPHFLGAHLEVVRSILDGAP